jgi:hypothetical protein
MKIALGRFRLAGDDAWKRAGMRTRGKAGLPLETQLEFLAVLAARRDRETSGAGRLGRATARPKPRVGAWRLVEGGIPEARLGSFGNAEDANDGARRECNQYENLPLLGPPAEVGPETSEGSLRR